MPNYFDEKINQISDDCQITGKYKSTAPSEYGDGGLCHESELHKIKGLAQIKATCSDVDGPVKDACLKSVKTVSEQIKNMGAWKNVPGGPELLHYIVEEK